MGQPIGGPLNEEADLQQALSLFISHVVLIYNNTAEENMRPAGPAKVNDALQVEKMSVWIWLEVLDFYPANPTAPIFPQSC